MYMIMNWSGLQPLIKMKRYSPNLQSIRANTNSKGNIPEEDFQLKYIQASAKTYFRNIHTKAQISADPAKAEQQDEKLLSQKHRTRRATVSLTISIKKN